MAKNSVGRGGKYFTKVVCGISKNQRTREEWNLKKNTFLCLNLHFVEQTKCS